jgi:hypothetical protein
MPIEVMAIERSMGAARVDFENPLAFHGLP